MPSKRHKGNTLVTGMKWLDVSKPLITTGTVDEKNDITKRAYGPNTASVKKNCPTRPIAVGILFIPRLVFAAAPFTGGATALSADILTIVTPIAGIALIAVGVICWFGKISWLWFAALVVGIVLVFGNQQIVSWIRGLFGV